MLSWVVGTLVIEATADETLVVLVTDAVAQWALTRARTEPEMWKVIDSRGSTGMVEHTCVVDDFEDDDFEDDDFTLLLVRALAEHVWVCWVRALVPILQGNAGGLGWAVRCGDRRRGCRWWWASRR
ncbi:MAG: hypothetical protein GY708_18030 [Actinomycetia bacterium]|nr:hypothetical protein [Actinomycetes bacterium]